MIKQKKQPQTFSQFFNLNKSQDELEFLDIYANRDKPVFLDPYGLSAMGSNWGRECESQIATYFQFLVDSIRDEDRSTIKKLLNALHEVEEISLGYSTSRTEGRGIGPKQAKEILKSFENSHAAKSGDIKDIADCALMIPGINRDKISDITANILKRELIKFTQKQCRIYNIPMRKVPVNNAFDPKTFSFTSFYAELPVVNGKTKILLPLSSVRHVPHLSKEIYYRHFVLEYLRAEHQHAGDSLATVLKNGEIKVRIADLKKRYPLGADFLYKFSKNNPKILDKYKSELRKAANLNSRPVLVTKKKVLSAKERIEFIKNIKPGKLEAGKFHKFIFETLNILFGDRVSSPKVEDKINEARKRIDITFTNTGKTGFFHDLNILHHVKCPKIFIECKNYVDELGNPEIDQLQGRFSKHRGMFGIIVCRSIKNKDALIARCRDALHSKQEYIIVLEDNDIFTLINFKEEKEEGKIDEYLSAKIDKLIM